MSGMQVSWAVCTACFVVSEGQPEMGRIFSFLCLFSAKQWNLNENCDTPAVTEHNQPPYSNIQNTKMYSSKHRAPIIIFKL